MLCLSKRGGHPMQTSIQVVLVYGSPFNRHHFKYRNILVTCLFTFCCPQSVPGFQNRMTRLTWCQSDIVGSICPCPLPACQTITLLNGVNHSTLSGTYPHTFQDAEPETIEILVHQSKSIVGNADPFELFI